MRTEPRDEGVLVFNDDDRGVASVETHLVSYDREGRIQVKKRPKEEWVVHFCAGKFSLAELDDLLKVIAGL